jgi:hypothetical protein
LESKYNNFTIEAQALLQQKKKKETKKKKKQKRRILGRLFL